MQSVKSIHDPTPVLDRLSVRFALLFVAAFMGTLVLLGVWALMTKIGENRDASTETSIQAPAIVIDPKIEADLSKALTFDATPAVTQVQNPFVDRANLAGSAAAAATAASTTTGKVNASSTSSNAGGTQSSGTLTSIGATVPGAQLGAFTQAVDNTRARYEEWIARQKRGEFVVPESEVLGVADLVPVGFASGGDRGAEVMLMSLSLCRTFTFAAGTRFFDGFLNGFDQREVVFIFQNGIRRKSYATEEICRQEAPARSAGINN